MFKVLISDKMEDIAKQILTSRGIEVDVITGLNEDELVQKIADYDGLIIRSATKVTSRIIEAAEKLKVIGRAGIGVDNIDINAASQKGIVVMNTPFGNAITTAEHAIAMMMSLSRNIPLANKTTHEGLWQKSRFMGVELMGKTLGIIGCGNIGSIVASRALGLKMNVIGYDPFLSEERAKETGITKVDLDTLFKEADFISLHTPKTEATKNIINKDSIEKMKDGVRIINCARGGLVVESDLKDALETGKVAAAALDVFETEPAKENILFGLENVVVTPHLGASTVEAQAKVTLQIAEQISDYLLKGSVSNALNMPAISAEDAPRLKPYFTLSEILGSFVGQLTSSAIKKIIIEYEGDVAELKVKPLTSLILKGILSPSMEAVNIVSAPIIAEKNGIEVTEAVITHKCAYHTLIRVTVSTENQTRAIAGTLDTSEQQNPRITEIKGINLDAKPSRNMLYITNRDKPGFIGQVGTFLGENNVNIADFYLGRLEQGGDAIILASIDNAMSEDLLNQVREFENANQVVQLSFNNL